jgi:hypothetical protein
MLQAAGIAAGIVIENETVRVPERSELFAVLVDEIHAVIPQTQGMGEFALTGMDR